jgi:acid phosphatase type 7
MNPFKYFLPILLLIGPMMFSPVGGTALKNADVALTTSDPIIAAAGDIACDPLHKEFNGGNGTSVNCRQKYTSDLLVNGGYAAVLPLGDNQYYCGGYQAFMQSYDLSWGRVKDITHPVVGNHEYVKTADPIGPSTGCDDANANAAGYFNYFGAAAGDPGKGYYSYDIGDWHLIALNSNCGDVGDCSPTSPQGEWLLADLAAHSNMCTLAYWHIPFFSSGGRAENNSRDLWQILYDHKVDVVLNGHDHIYERFLPQRPDGTVSLARGMRQFTVGTGGANHTPLETIAANSEVRNADTYGILKLTLHATSYDWEFVPEPGKTFTDSGTGYCTGDIQDTIPPTPPSNLTASAVSANEVRLKWTAATDNLGVVGYQVFRDGAYIGSATDAAYVDTTTQAGVTYNYSVVAMDVAELTSSPSNPASATPIGFFNDDFESNSLSRWTSVTNLTVQQQEVFAGSYAARGISNNLPTFAYKQLSVAQNELYYRLRFKIISQTQTMNLLKFRTGTGSSILGVFVSNTGVLGSRNDVVAVSTFSTTPVSKGAWHELQVRVLINGSAGQAEFWLDGNRVDTLSQTEAFGTNPIGRIQLGENASGANFDVAYDNVTLDTQFIGTPIATQTPTFTPTASVTASPTFTPVFQGSIIFSDGFETGNLSQWTSGQGLIVQTQHVANGNYAAQGTSAATSATYARKSLTVPQSDLYYCLRFKVISQGSNTVNLLKFRTAANTSILSLSVNNVGQLSYRNDVVGKSFNSTVGVSLGSWHAIQAHVRIADTASQIEVWYDDVPVTALSRTESLGTNPIGILQLGENSSGLTYDIAFDDVSAFLAANVTSTPTSTPTQTATETSTSSPTASATPSPTATMSQTSTSTSTSTGTATATSTWTATATQTSGGGGSFTFTPTADAYVYSVNPTTNFGSLTVLRADASPDTRSYLRFSVQGLTGAVKRATLRIYANSASTSGINIHAVSDNSWTESTINYNNAPSFSSPIGSFSPVVSGTWVSIDITAYLIGNGTYNLALTTPGSTAISLASRQSGANSPQLIIEVSP